MARHSWLAAVSILYFPFQVANAGVILDSTTWDENGHSYVLVEFDCFQTDCDVSEQLWDSARDDVEETLGDGFRLAAITSAEEDQFIEAFLDGIGWEWWIGGLQDPIDEPVADAGWTWVTGESFAFTDWCGGEPNDAGQPGLEQHLALDFGGICWNDEGSAIGIVRGYLAETFEPAGVPEPGSLVLLALGVLGLGVVRRATASA